MIQKKILVIIFVLLSHSASAQHAHSKIPDSLADKSFDYLSQASISTVEDSINRACTPRLG